MVGYQMRRAIEGVVRAWLANVTVTIKNLVVTGTFNLVWQDWIPTVTQSGNVTITINEARWCQLGKVVFCYAYLSVTGSGTAGNDIVIGQLPAGAPLAHDNQYMAIGTAQIQDAGTANYVGSVWPPGGGTLKFWAHNQASPIGTTPSFGLAAGDTIGFTARWETT